MLYMEMSLTGQLREGAAHIFSDKDNTRELENFRCLVRAPKHASRNGDKRPYLVLFGSPKDRAKELILATFVFATPDDRIKWEASQPEIAKRYPVPFIVTRHQGALK